MNAYLTKSGELVVNGTNGLLNCLLKGSTDGHDFTNGLHTAGKSGANSAELLQIPSRNLDNAVIQRRFEASACDFGDAILDIV